MELVKTTSRWIRIDPGRRDLLEETQKHRGKEPCGHGDRHWSDASTSQRTAGNASRPRRREGPGRRLPETIMYFHSSCMAGCGQSSFPFQNTQCVAQHNAISSLLLLGVYAKLQIPSALCHGGVGREGGKESRIRREGEFSQPLHWELGIEGVSERKLYASINMVSASHMSGIWGACDSIAIRRRRKHFIKCM